jgi:hypothetical protein
MNTVTLSRSGKSVNNFCRELCNSIICWSYVNVAIDVWVDECDATSN